jgi:hypothetical protein
LHGKPHPASGWFAFRQDAHGPSLTRDELSASYAIIRHNVRTYRSDGVIAIVKGKAALDLALKNLEDCQSPADRHEGWRYFFEKTDLKAGTDPAEATQLRQAQLEKRESEAEQNTSSLFPPESKNQ